MKLILTINLWLMINYSIGTSFRTIVLAYTTKVDSLVSDKVGAAKLERDRQTCTELRSPNIVKT